MIKKPYEKPIVQKIKLTIKDAILANCHDSPNLTPKEPTCAIAVGCFNPPPTF